MENEREKWFGYKFESQEDMPLCMIQIIDDEIVEELKKLNIKSKLDQWVVSAGRCHNIETLNPFDSLDVAMNTAHEKYGVDQFVQPLTFHF